jgi:predicted GNAT superfamily acetyltransferase
MPSDRPGSEAPALTKGVNVVSASDPNNFLWSIDKKAWSFYLHLMKSYRKADINGDGKCLSAELHSYIRAAYSRAANQIDGQEPQLQSLTRASDIDLQLRAFPLLPFPPDWYLP